MEEVEAMEATLSKDTEEDMEDTLLKEACMVMVNHLVRVVWEAWEWQEERRWVWELVCSVEL